MIHGLLADKLSPTRQTFFLTKVNQLVFPTTALNQPLLQAPEQKSMKL